MELDPVLRFKNITHSHVVTGGPDTGETDRLTFDPGRTYGCVKDVHGAGAMVRTGVLVCIGTGAMV